MSRERLNTGHVLTLLSLLVVVVYGHTIQAQFVWDDVFLIERNQRLGEFRSAWSLAWGDFFGQAHTTQSGYLRPVPTLLNYLTVKIFGYSPVAFHAIQLMLHLLVLGIAVRVFRNWGLTNLSILVGLAFYTVHPMQAEALSFVSCRPELLAAIFVLLTCLCVQNSRDGGSFWWCIFACLSLTLGFLSKETAVVIVPFIWFLGVDYSKKVTWVLTGFALALVALRFSWMPANLGDQVGAEINLSLALNLLAFYVQQLFLFEGPRCLYTYLDVSDWQLQTLITVVLLIGFGLWIILRRRRSMVVLGIIWFLLFLGPVLHLIPFGTLAADRYLYLPLFGVALGVAHGTDALIRKQSRSTVIVALVGVLVLMAFSTLTRFRSQEWQNEITLWSAEIEMPPLQGHALVELGTALADAQKIDDAHKAYRLAWTINPGGLILFRNLIRIESRGLNRELGRALRNAVLDPAVTTKTLRFWSEKMAALNQPSLSQLLHDQATRNGK